MIARPVPVLLLSHQLGIGGSERQLTVTALSLDRSRFEPHVGCFHEGFLAEDLRQTGIRVVRFPVTSFRNWSAVQGARRLGAYLKEHRVQLVHTFDVPLTVFGVPVARFYRTPVVLSSQRAHRALAGRYRPLLRVTDRLVHGTVVNCEFIREHLIRDEGVPPERIHLCYNGLDTSVFHPHGRIRNEPNLTIGTVCALRPEKGLLTLLESFAAVYQTNPSLRLVIVGSGPMLGELEAQAAQLGIAERTQFEPATPAIADRLREIDIFVLPSLSEALSNSLMEAMACGCAAIASRVGGNPELIRHMDTGLLFETANSSDLAAQLFWYLRNPGLRENIADAGTEYIQTTFSVEKSARRMREIYESTLTAVSL